MTNTLNITIPAPNKNETKLEFESPEFFNPVVGCVGIITSIETKLGPNQNIIEFTVERNTIQIPLDQAPNWLKIGARVRISYTDLTIEFINPAP